MNKVSMKARATIVGKVFASKGVVLPRSEQLNLVAQLEGARDWNHACGEGQAEVTPVADVAFDELQLHAAQVYCEGDFSHITSKAPLKSVDDLLFLFAIQEIGEAAGDQEEAVNMLHNAIEQLETLASALAVPRAKVSAQFALVPKQTEPAMHYEATAASGAKQDWAIRLISDRFGDVNPRVPQYPHLADWVREYPEDFEKLFGRCLDEMAFVAEVNGKRGVLYEVEIVTQESEGLNSTGTPHCNVPESKRLAQLARDVAALELAHPKLTWAFGGTIGGADDRLGVWAFCPEDQLFSVQEASAVTASLYEKFYPH